MNITEAFIRQGVLFSRTCSPSVALAEWLELGKLLADFLHLDHQHLTEAEAVRIYHFYLPVCFWLKRQIDEVIASSSRHRAAFIGVSCPQGGGKTTLLAAAQHVLGHMQATCVALSLDDFYLTYEEQEALAQRYSGNRLLQGRGQPGTHDLALMCNTIRRLLTCGPNDVVPIPRYDKSLRGAKGDRLPAERWPTVAGPVHAVLLEGWCLGFRPAAKEALHDPDLAAVNDSVADHFVQLCQLMDAFIVMQVDDHQWVFEWRLEAERHTIAQGKPGMTDDEVAQFCSRFMPGYVQYLPGLYCEEVVPHHQLQFRINKARCPIDS